MQRNSIGRLATGILLASSLAFVRPNNFRQTIDLSPPAEPETDEQRAAREEAEAKMREAREHVAAIERAKRFARAQHNNQLERAKRESQNFMTAHAIVKGKAAKKAAKKAAGKMRQRLETLRTDAAKNDISVGLAEDQVKLVEQA